MNATEKLPIKIKNKGGCVLYLVPSSYTYSKINELGKLQPVISVKEYLQQSDNYEVIQ